MSFSTNLNYLLKLNDISVVEFAKKLGVSRIQVFSYLNGHNMPSGDKLTRISSIFKVPQDVLVGSTIDPLESFSSLSLPEKIRRLRIARGLSIRALAIKSGIHQGSIQKLENGDIPKAETLQKIAKALSVEVTTLTGKEAAFPIPKATEKVPSIGSEAKVVIYQDGKEVSSRALGELSPFVVSYIINFVLDQKGHKFAEKLAFIFQVSPESIQGLVNAFLKTPSEPYTEKARQSDLVHLKQKTR